MDAITDWLKELLISGIISNLSGLFDSVNEKVGEISTQVGLTPQAWNGGEKPFYDRYPSHRRNHPDTGDDTGVDSDAHRKE